MTALVDFLRDHSDMIVPMLILAAWLALQLWILPKMGVST